MDKNMRIIISPAKKMNMETDSLPHESLPQFLDEAELLLKCLKSMAYEQLKKLWGCSDSLARLNFERLQCMDLRQSLTPALLAYEGIQYRYMAPGIFEYQHLDYIKAHLRILSGFYGLLLPFDGVTPYRLEMQAGLAGDGYRNLYEFWGDKLARQLAGETDLLINLASKEYSKIISSYLPEKVHLLTCSFAEWKEERLIEKGTLCKMARGEMVRFLAERQITESEEIKDFDRQGYAYSDEYSKPDHFVFIR
ncbi:peroxide stress protein YaaA [Sporomusa sphaeroides]|jgi:cytoplasmic iron level regulating protein YaaA (DUF328/UPF0246 family)